MCLAGKWALLVSLGLFFVLPKIEGSSRESANPQTEQGEKEFHALTRELHEKNKLFHKTSWPELKKSYAKYFETKHADLVEQAWGEPASGFRTFLARHDTIKEDFFVTLHPLDDAPAAMKVFHHLWSNHPDEFESGHNLAIAVSLVWDQPRHVASTAREQHGAAALDDELDALGNFVYYSKFPPSAREQFRVLPCEFLMNVVNHRTPLDERKWAFEHYTNKRKMIGKIYFDVPYRTERLIGKPYTFQNMQTYGGVCTAQGDYAARIGKSLGIPTLGAGGRNDHGGGHAWVSWLEIQFSGPNEFRFSMETEAQYGCRRAGHYDQQTGVETPVATTTIKLKSLAHDEKAFRHAVLLVKAYPELASAMEFDSAKRFDYLKKVLQVNPACVEAWQTIAKHIADGEFDGKDRATLSRFLNQFAQVFKDSPDFIVELCDDMFAFESKPKQRESLYRNLCESLEKQNRPDLASGVKIRYGKKLLDAGQIVKVAEIHGKTCLRFPENGHFMPQALDEFEQICYAHPEDAKVRNLVSSFYKNFLAAVLKNVGDNPLSEHQYAVCDRAVNAYNKIGDRDSAERVKKYQQDKGKAP